MTDTFETFWSDYPRKDGKEYAKTCYTKAVKAHGAATIMAGLSRFNRKMIAEDRERKHIMQASKFLNQKVFLDGEEDLVDRASSADRVVSEVLVGGHVIRYPDILDIEAEIRRGRQLYPDQWRALKGWQEAGGRSRVDLPPEPKPLPTKEERAAQIQEMKERGLLWAPSIH